MARTATDRPFRDSLLPPSSLSAASRQLRRSAEIFNQSQGRPACRIPTRRRKKTRCPRRRAAAAATAPLASLTRRLLDKQQRNQTAVVASTDEASTKPTVAYQTQLLRLKASSPSIVAPVPSHFTPAYMLTALSVNGACVSRPSTFLPIRRDESNRRGWSDACRNPRYARSRKHRAHVFAVGRTDSSSPVAVIDDA